MTRIPNAAASRANFAADPANPDDQRRRFRQMHDPSVLRQFLPFAPELLRDVVLQPAGKGEHKGHHMGADVVAVDLPEIGDRDRMSDQLRVVIARGRCRLRCLQPTQLLCFAQQVGRDRAKSRIGMGDYSGRMRVVIGDDDLHLGQRGGEGGAPLPRLVGLRRQHHEFARYR
jgi:hypothetical protein